MAPTTRAPLTAAQQRELANLRASWAIEGQHVTDAEFEILERVAAGGLELREAYALMQQRTTPAHR